MIHNDAKHLVARAKAYDAQERPTALDRPTIAVHLPQWEPPAGDITDPQELHAFLSPEVRRFAIVMESLLRDTGSLERDSTRPVGMCHLLVQDATRLRAAASHPGVTDNLGHPLSPDHVDRNPRRMQNVLREAAKTACRALLVADACGALEGGNG